MILQFFKYLRIFYVRTEYTNGTKKKKQLRVVKLKVAVFMGTNQLVKQKRINILKSGAFRGGANLSLV